MAKSTYPTLRSNEVCGALFNQVISQQTFADNIVTHYGDMLSENRVDGTLFGDVKTYFSTDVLKSVEFLGDEEAANLLELHRPQDPETQAIYLDIFRQIAVTTDDYLSKRAWGDEGAFAEFQNVIQTWVPETKEIHETTIFNTFVGTNESNIGKQTQTVTLTKGDTEDHRRMRASEISNLLADILDEIADYSRDYNDYGNLRAYDASKLDIVWNSKVLNTIQKRDLPTVFNSEMLSNITGTKLPARYFGTPIAGSGTGDGKKIRSMIERDYNTVKMNSKEYNEKLHVFAGDLIPNGKPFEEGTAYTEDPTILFKIVGKGKIPFMTSLSVGTSFFNSKALTTTNYLTFGYNTLQHLKNYPMITVRESVK